ncbi:MAG TPA: lytic transglycosylase domain-containing protein [Rhodanobacteraceae bacterium]|nr:lytic transglycosylase domain-containing protein [Rhodanobacteraceae bacterium]
MDATFRPGDFCGRRRAVRGALACLVLLLACVALPAGASVLYRCIGADGVTAFVSHTRGYKHCVKVGDWGAPAASHRDANKHNNQPSGTVLPGTPPRPVAADPHILKIIPLGEPPPTPPVALPAPPSPQAWQPLPVAAMQALASRMLPKLLGVELPPPPPAPASTVAPASAGTVPIPLKVDADVAKPPRRGAVYRVVKKNGTVLYTNIDALAQGHNATKLFTYIVECYACDVHSKIDWNTVPLHLAEYRGDIEAAAKLSGVNAALLRAIIHAESGFNPRALSYKGAQGLMQLMPATAGDLGVADAFDPAENIDGGARYLAALLHDFHGDVKLAAAAYNAGEGAVTKYAGVPPYAETQVYVKRVALLYERYRKALAGTNPSVVAAGG